jgi:SAM-dependent methyltransferase
VARARPDIEVWRDAADRRRLFDAAALAYDAHRAGYPEQLFDALAALAPSGGRVLEVGAGTGIASVPLAMRGVRMTCLEPADGMAAIARAKLGPFSDVELVASRFEDWRAEPASFDLVFAADAWHWVDQRSGPARAADLLRPGGYLALAWHARTALEPAEAEEALLGLVRELVSDGAEWMRRTGDEGDVFLGPVDRSGRFDPIDRHRFPTREVVDGPGLAGEFGTFSWILALDEPSRRALLDGIVALVGRQPGGRVVRTAVNVLYLARRRAP